MENMGKRLDQMLKEQGVERKNLARDLKVSESIVSQWTKGTKFPSLKNLVVLSDVLGCSLDWSKEENFQIRRR